MKLLNKIKFNRKGSAEIVAIVILVAIAGILAIAIASGNSNAIFEANQKAQEAISLTP
jgi:FlaG/FlaF family flagellin (archaellin)